MTCTRTFLLSALLTIPGATGTPQKQKPPQNCTGATLLTSWYCQNQRMMANNHQMDCQALTAANNELALGTKLHLTFNSRSVVVSVTDRGGFIPPRRLVVTQGVARLLGFERQGLACVTVEVERTPDHQVLSMRAPHEPATDRMP